jgi:Fur family ferric uptake transcriptional regulator
MKKSEHCNADEMLKNSGLSRTEQRLNVLNILLKEERPLNAREILDLCGNGRMNRVTVYRIMESFRNGGIVRELPTESGVKYFEIACRHNPVHPHFYCRDCGSMACLGPLTATDIWELVAGPHAFRIDHISVSITGLCKNCSAK